MVKGHVTLGMVQIHKNTSAGEGVGVFVLRALVNNNNDVDAWESKIHSLVQPLL